MTHAAQVNKPGIAADEEEKNQEEALTKAMDDD